MVGPSVDRSIGHLPFVFVDVEGVVCTLWGSDAALGVDGRCSGESGAMRLQLSQQA